MGIFNLSFTGTILTIVYDGEYVAEEYKINNRDWQVSNEFDNVPRGVNKLQVRFTVEGVQEVDEACVFFYNTKVPEQTDGFTMSFGVASGLWHSFHSYLPRWYFNHYEMFSYEGTALYRHNANDNGRFYGVIYPSYIDALIAPYMSDNRSNTFLYKNIEWSTNAYVGDFPIRDKTIDKINIRNHHQSTGLVSVKKAGCKYVNGKWYFGEVRDVAKWKANKPLTRKVLDGAGIIGIDLDRDTSSKKGMITSPYIIVRFQMDNATTGTVTLYEFRANYDPINI